MKLFMAKTSPYVRKVLVTAIETGLYDRLEQVEVSVSPVAHNAEVAARNPLGKIPALLTDGGETLFDSRVICEYLDSLSTDVKLFHQGAARWTELRRQAAGDGLLDAAILARYETALRPQEKGWHDWLSGQKGKIARALDVMETEADSLGQGLDIGLIAYGCALGYLDFRFADDDWRKGRPKLAAWFERFGARDSMKRTAPPA